jgi:hypothetical protein
MPEDGYQADEWAIAFRWIPTAWDRLPDASPIAWRPREWCAAEEGGKPVDQQKETMRSGVTRPEVYVFRAVALAASSSTRTVASRRYRMSGVSPTEARGISLA